NNKDGREGDLSGINVDTTPLAVTAAANQTAVEGASKSFNLGSFADSNGNFFGVNEWAGTAGGGYSTDIGQFSLTAQGPWSVDVNWGDGSHTIFPKSTAGSLGTQTHTYAEESAADHPNSNPYLVTVTVTNTATNQTDNKTFNVAV